ncbi:hypothetical protein ACOMHN_019861 [Nucella lapillus]
MKDIQTQYSTLIKQPFSSRLTTAAESDAEPFRKAPAPKAFPSSEILSGFVPDPMLTVTPEKSLGERLLRGQQVGKYGRTSGGGGGIERKGRQRVWFAPDTRTSPPAKDSSAERDKKGFFLGGGSCISDNVSKVMSDDEESMPRSFTAISNKLYRPGRYADHDDDKHSSSAPSKSTSGVSAPKRYTVETQGNKTVYVPVDHCAKNITSEYSDLQRNKAVTATIVRHKPIAAYEVSDDEDSRTELNQAFENSSSVTRHPRTPPRTPSPSLCRNSPHRSHSSSPSRRSPSARRSPSPVKSPNRLGHSPCSSPDRRTPVEGLEVFSPDPTSQSAPMVQVIREAPYQPKRNEYVFPFVSGDEDKQGYDSSSENPLARPEFNSALKISQELKSVKGKQPDTWGAVSQKLKTCERKRTQIQEKASSRVNIQLQSGLYSDLVDVDVPLDDLCQHVEKDIRLRAPSPKPSSLRVPVGKEPDIMEFFSPEFQPELPDLTLTGIRPITENLTTADPILAFDLYRHNRAWNGLTDS